MKPPVAMAEAGMPSPFRRLGLAMLLGSTVLAGGCASVLNGVGGSERYACRAPVGAQCTSVSGTYANGGLPPSMAAAQRAGQPSGPHQRANHPNHPQLSPASASQAARQAGPGASAPTNETGIPVVEKPDAALRTAPRVLRLWVAPWEDSDGDLHEATHVHVLIDHGRWRIDQLQPGALPARITLPSRVKPPTPSTKQTTTPSASPQTSPAPTSALPGGERFLSPPDQDE